MDMISLDAHYLGSSLFTYRKSAQYYTYLIFWVCGALAQFLYGVADRGCCFEIFVYTEVCNVPSNFVNVCKFDKFHT
jgi:hypothetical protein